MAMISGGAKAAQGRSNSVTNGCFQVSEFNDRFPAMNLKRRRSLADPFLTLALLQTGHSAEAIFWD